jgi:hypothetical protein
VCGCFAEKITPLLEACVCVLGLCVLFHATLTRGWQKPELKESRKYLPQPASFVDLLPARRQALVHMLPR